MSYTKIMPRRGTAYEWSTENPVLAEGEFAIEFPDAGLGTGLCRFKIGDGFKHWNELAYGFDGASATSITGGNAYASHLIQLRSDIHQNWLEANPILDAGEIIFVSDLFGFKVGDGASQYSELRFSAFQDVMDFGDEDSSNGVHTLDDYAELNEVAKSNIANTDMDQYISSEPKIASATLQDLLGVEDYGDESEGISTVTPEPEIVEIIEETPTVDQAVINDEQSIEEAKAASTIDIDSSVKVASVNVESDTTNQTTVTKKKRSSKKSTTTTTTES